MKLLAELPACPVAINTNTISIACERGHGSASASYRRIVGMAVNSSPLPSHPPYQLNPSSHLGRPTHSQPSNSYGPNHLIPSGRQYLTNSSPAIGQMLPTHDNIVGYLICFKVRHTGSQQLPILRECNKKRIYYSKQYILFKKTYYNM